MWSTDPSSFHVVHHAWNKDQRPGMECHQLYKSLKNTTSALKIWNIEVFGYANKQISEFEAELQLLQKQKNFNLAYQKEI